ncbi:hypothetical protein FY534_05405 [Alicyclobacillus sp. TC]|uniref:hypothetical protein n=1 Tax=Alicyclobacillus TaxID=29330 RepID=UPI00101AD4F6|nr:MULTISPECIES: hypothetical protein [Alicyclobacillus]QRF23170.1 hypothetical protein FY534_05405 [Alicyclobacillus sp. TC]
MNRGKALRILIDEFWPTRLELGWFDSDKTQLLRVTAKRLRLKLLFKALRLEDNVSFWDLGLGVENNFVEMNRQHESFHIPSWSYISKQA